MKIMSFCPWIFINSIQVYCFEKPYFFFLLAHKFCLYVCFYFKQNCNGSITIRFNRFLRRSYMFCAFIQNSQSEYIQKTYTSAKLPGPELQTFILPKVRSSHCTTQILSSSHSSCSEVVKQLFQI